MKRKNKLNHGKQETGEKGVLKTLLFFFLAAFLFLLWGSWLLPVTDPEIVMVTAARSKKAGNSHLMLGANPVWIVAFSGREDQ